MTSKAASLAALVSAVVFGARAYAQTAPEPHDDEAIVDAEQQEPTGLAPRFELDAGIGTADARALELRGTDRFGRFDAGIAGRIDERVDRGDRSAAVRLDHARGSRRARVFGAIDRSEEIGRASCRERV